MTSIKRQLEGLNVRPSKARGQNFLIHEHVAQQIVRFAAPQPGESLVEIGPGLGALTKHLAVFSPLTVIELEENFCAYLRDAYPTVNVINQDVREVDFKALGQDLVVFGNLPYSFSSEIVFHLLDNSTAIRRAVLLLQREFVERLAAEPGGKEYGTISVSSQLQAELRTGPVIAGNNFHPPADVESMVVEFTFRPENVGAYTNVVHFRQVVRAAFSKRRKKLHNSLKASCVFPPNTVEAALETSGISGDRRAETLSVEEFVDLARALEPH